MRKTTYQRLLRQYDLLFLKEARKLQLLNEKRQKKENDGWGGGGGKLSEGVPSTAVFVNFLRMQLADCFSRHEKKSDYSRAQDDRFHGL